MKEMQQRFFVTGEDLAFDFAHNFDEVFMFSPFESDAPNSVSGVRQSENLGYDFQNECTPVIEIHPLSEDSVKGTDFDLSDLLVNITIEDTALAIRKTIFKILVSEITETQNIPIDLKSYVDLSFYRGFEIKCFITRCKDLEADTVLIWHKSQIIYQTNFIVQTSIDTAFFEFDIAWVDFSDEAERKDLFYFVEWKSSEISTAIDVDCFQVKANAELEEQFKRLDSNQSFGGLCIRMIAEQILKEVIQQSLRFASPDKEPLVGSLHDKLISLFNRIDFDFNDLARMSQSDDPMEQMYVATEVTKILQKLNEVGSALGAIKFGGCR